MSRIPRQGDFTNTWDFMCIKERKRTDREYASYIDHKTIGLLFCLMTVMAGLQSLGVFKKAGERLLGYVKGPGAVSAVLVLQTIAANLGSMLTPIGNPQNLYLYSKAGLSAGRFMELMAPYTAVSLGMLGICLAVAAVRNRMPEKEKNGGEQGPVSGCGLFPSPDILRVFCIHRQYGKSACLLPVPGPDSGGPGNHHLRGSQPGYQQCASRPFAVRIFRGLQCADCGDESGSASCAGFVGYPLLKKDFRCYT